MYGVATSETIVAKIQFLDYLDAIWNFHGQKLAAFERGVRFLCTNLAWF